MKVADLVVPVPVVPVLSKEMVTSSLDHHTPIILPLRPPLPLLAAVHLHSIEKYTIKKEFKKIFTFK